MDVLLIKTQQFQAQSLNGGIRSLDMLLTYLNNGLVVSVIEGFPVVWEENNQLIIDGGDSPLLNDLTKAGWGYYKDKKVWEYDEEGIELPVYIDDLMLEPMDSNDLPHSEHIGKLISVNPSLSKPATVRRRFHGVNYDVQCLVSQTAVSQFQNNELEIGDFVKVSFVSEIPDTEEINVAILEYKIYKSW